MKRSRMEIIYDILTSIDRGVKSKTRIMYAANLDWRSFSKYISFLEEEGFVSRNGNGYVLTEKGRIFISKLREIEELLTVTI